MRRHVGLSGVSSPTVFISQLVFVDARVFEKSQLSVTWTHDSCVVNMLTQTNLARFLWFSCYIEGVFIDFTEMGFVLPPLSLDGGFQTFAMLHN